MSRRAAAVVLVCAALLASRPAFASSPPTFVGPTRLFHTITEGLANAFSASQLKIDPGTYAECPTVTGLVLLQIVGKKGVVIDATGCDVGLTINDGDNVTVKGVTIVGAKTGILVKAAAQRVTVTKTTVRDPGTNVLETGVKVDGAADATLDKVTVLGAKGQGVQVVSAARTIVRKSTIANGTGAGVRVDLGTNVTIAKNTLGGLGAFGVEMFRDGVGGAVDSLVQSNKISDTAGGIHVAGANNVIEKNKLTDLSNTGIYAEGPGGSSTYAKNTMLRVVEAAIIAFNDGDTFEKNTAKDTLGDAIDVIGHGNRFIGNKVIGALGVGVFVEPAASGNTFERTSTTKAGADGFFVLGGGNTFTKVKASKSGGLDLHDSAGAATTNVYTDCKFKTSNVP